MPTVEILEISAPAFRLLSRRQENHAFSVSLYELDREIKRRETEYLDDPKDLKKRLPRKYYDFLDVFSKSDSDALPPYRSYDHQIVLDKHKELSYGLLYS